MKKMLVYEEKEAKYEHIYKTDNKLQKSRCMIGV